MGGRAAYTDNRKNEIVVSIPIYEAACDDDPLARLVIAHEIGHFKLDHTHPLAKSTINTRTWDILEDSEYQAVFFANALLAPVTGIKNLDLMNPRNIAEKFHIPLPEAFDYLLILRKENLI